MFNIRVDACTPSHCGMLYNYDIYNFLNCYFLHPEELYALSVPVTTPSAKARAIAALPDGRLFVLVIDPPERKH